MLNKFILYSVLTVSAYFIVSCGNGKDAVPAAPTKDEEEVIPEIVLDETATFIDAVVLDKTAENECGFVLQVLNKDGLEQLLEPLALDDKFKVDGLKVEVRYTFSRRQSLCANSIPITIDEIKLK